MDDWGLQAVVRGYCTTTASSFVHVDEPFFFDPALLEEEAHVAVATPFANVLSSESSAELDELWKPFCSSSSTSRSAAAILHQQRPISSPGAPSHSQPRSKRGKSQQKRVVCHVPAEGLSSDLWAWRKYGQKPIKGSPYPRGYYRCSSSKGCIARKQVERSRNDPAMFVLTYTGEHNHPAPTHRNSLAGSTRQKYSDQNIAGASSTTTTTPDSEVGGGGESRNGTWLHSADLSPTTPSTAVMEEESSKMSLYEEDAEPGMEAEWMGETEEYSDMFLDLDELYNDVFTDRLDDCFSMGFPAWDCGMGTGAACCDSLQRGQNRITEEQNRGEERK